MDDQRAVLNEEGRLLWDQKAEFWDKLHGDDGNTFHRRLISPSVERLLELRTGERILDIGCGSGVLARRLAALGARITAVDFSEGLLERARARGQSAGEPIQYRVVDATDEDELRALGEGLFDAAVSTMALMDMSSITPLYRAARALVKPGGRLVVATAHPVINSSNPLVFSEREETAQGTVIRRGVRLTSYLDVPPFKAIGAADDPAPHTYYHRPLHQLLGEAFAAGWVLDALEEPAFDPEDAGDAPPLSWRTISQLPPVLTYRLRHA
ncbi:MAG: methyltransferase domain-containing protein [Chloroflexi bacterium]|nr:methyltransferase domain-containing protein [Chloroflexota bacterium]